MFINNDYLYCRDNKSHANIKNFFCNPKFLVTKI